jgi:hypothetical protein
VEHFFGSPADKFLCVIGSAAEKHRGKLGAELFRKSPACAEQFQRYTGNFPVTLLCKDQTPLPWSVSLASDTSLTSDIAPSGHTLRQALQSWQSSVISALPSFITIAS